MDYISKYKISPKNNGFSVLEVVLAAAIFSVFSVAALPLLLQGLKGENQAGQAEVALEYAAEGNEAVRAIRDQSFDILNNTESSGLHFSDGQWELQDDPDEFDIYQRTIVIASTRRDGDGNIVSEGGEEDLDMKKVVSSVSWTALSGEEVSVELIQYLSRWK